MAARSVVTDTAISALGDTERRGLDLLRTMEDPTAEGYLWDIMVEDVRPDRGKYRKDWYILFRGRRYTGPCTGGGMTRFLKDIAAAENRAGRVDTLLGMISGKRFEYR